MFDRAGAASTQIPALAEAETYEIRTAGVIGAGTMGAGIAMVFANAGIPVQLIDTQASARDRAQASIARTYATAVERGSLTPDLAGARLARIGYTGDLDQLATVDVAVEAVFEDLAVKQGVFERLAAACRPDAILATNTSTLDVDAIAAAAAGPQRCIGLHFFSPAHVMKLLEVVRAARTSPATIAASIRLGERLGKVPVVVGNADGFVGNRMLLSYRREAELLVLGGATPERVDAALEAFGFALGVFAVSDLAGIDVGVRAKQERLKRGAVPPFVVTDLPDALVAAGFHGQKTGRGYYRYETGNRRRREHPEIEPLIAAERQRLGMALRPVSDSEIVERCIYALVMEGALLLEQGVAASAADIDTIWLHGYGFPRARGGPMRFATETGLRKVLDAIERFAHDDPAFWRISPVLTAAARRGSFA